MPIILSSAIISTKRRSPVKLQCSLPFADIPSVIHWCIEYRGARHHFDTFEKTVEYLKYCDYIKPELFDYLDRYKKMLLEIAGRQIEKMKERKNK